MKSEETVTISSFTILLTVVLIYQAAVLLVAVDHQVEMDRVDLELVDLEQVDLERVDLEPVDLERVEMYPVDLEKVNRDRDQDLDPEKVDQAAILMTVVMNLGG